MGILKSILIRKGWTEEQIVPVNLLRHFFWDINWVKTFWFNFKALPIKYAVRIPFVIAYNVKIKNIGKIHLSGKITPGIISIGVIKIENMETNKDTTIFSNYGTMCAMGRMKIHPGAKIVIYKNALLNVGERVSIGSKTKVVCSKSIDIGDDFRMSWDGQLFDTDFHFLSKTTTGKNYRRVKAVKIGNNVFIGNRCTIGKGTIIPNGCVISCNSNVCGDFTLDGENLLLKGNPATVVNKGFTMSNGWYPKEEKIIAKEIGE